MQKLNYLRAPPLTICEYRMRVEICEFTVVVCFIGVPAPHAFFSLLSLQNFSISKLLFPGIYPMV